METIVHTRPADIPWALQREWRRASLSQASFAPFSSAAREVSADAHHMSNADADEWAHTNRSITPTDTAETRC